MKGSFSAAVLLLSSLGGVCYAQAPRPEPTNKRIQELEEQVQFLSDSISNLWDRVSRDSNQLDCDGGAYVELTPENSKLLFLASCEKIEPYLEGYKITIAIGNPHAASFEGVKGKLGHGETYEKTFSQTTPFSETLALKPGAWNRIVVTVNPLPAKDVRYVRLSFSFDTAYLGK